MDDDDFEYVKMSGHIINVDAVIEQMNVILKNDPTSTDTWCAVQRYRNELKKAIK